MFGTSDMRAARFLEANSLLLALMCLCLSTINVEGGFNALRAKPAAAPAKPPDLHDKPKLNAVKKILEKAVSEWQPKKIAPKQESKASPSPQHTKDNQRKSGASPTHSHLDPKHPKSFASKQNKLNEKGWFHYKHKVFSKTKPVAGTPAKAPNAAGAHQDHEHPQTTAAANPHKTAMRIQGSNSKVGGSHKAGNNLAARANVRGKHHVRHTLPGSVADKGPNGTSSRQSAAIGSLVFIIVAGLAVLCAVGSLFTAP